MRATHHSKTTSLFPVMPAKKISMGSAAAFRALSASTAAARFVRIRLSTIAAMPRQCSDRPPCQRSEFRETAPFRALVRGVSAERSRHLMGVYGTRGPMLHGFGRVLLGWVGGGGVALLRNHLGSGAHGSIERVWHAASRIPAATQGERHPHWSSE